MGESNQECTSDTQQVPELPDLVWHLILEQLSESNISTVCSVSATSRRLYMLSVPILYQKISLNHSKQHPGLLLRLTKPGTALTRFIQEITIQYGDWITPLILQQLAAIFSSTTQLRTLNWSGHYDIPSEILQNLHSASPNARIIVKGDFPYQFSTSELELDQEKCAGISSPNLYSLHASIPAEPHRARIAKLAVYHTLRTSPNLRKLEMDQQSGGCVRYGWEPGLEVELGVREGENLPQLEDLSSPMFSSEDIIRWGDMGGFSRLKTLSLSRGSTNIEAFIGRMPNLRSLTLELSWEDIKASETCLAKITGLEELVLNGYGMEFPFGILESNADTLKRLTIHAPEPYDPKRRPDVPVEDLRRLRETCMNLTDLAVDINREGEWPYAYLTELTKFTSVTHLTLLAEGTRGTGTPVLPELDLCAGKALFEFLLAQNPSPRLTHLTVERGGMGPWRGGRPGPGIVEEGNYRGVFNYSRKNGSEEIIAVEEEDYAARTRKWIESYQSRSRVDPWPELPSGLSISETTRLIDLLESGGEVKREDVFCEIDQNGVNEMYRGMFVGMMEGVKDLEEEKKKVIGMLRALVVRMGRVRDMERVFTKECTLFDVLSGRGDVGDLERGEEIVV